MKRKVTCFTSMALAVLMAVSPIAGNSFSVFAAEPSDDTTAIQVTPTEEELSDEIVVEADSDAIEVKKEMQASVKVGDTGESDITVEKEYLAGDSIPVHVTAENPADKAADFRLYFWDYGETLPEDKAEWSEVLTDACEDVKIAELQDTDEYIVDLKQGEDTVQGKVSFISDKDDNDQLANAYLSIELPAGAAMDTVFHISSDVAETVTVIPVFGAESENAFYGDAAAAQWKENPIVVEADQSEDTAETEPETEDADAIVVETEEPADSFLSIYVGESDTETSDEENSDIEVESETDAESEISVEAEGKENDAVTDTPDTAELNASDFATMRLVVLADDASVIANDSDVIGQYGNVYLLQFTSIQQAMNAYMYYKDKVTAVEPDATVEAAAETESVQEAEIAMTEDENPVAMLNEVEASEEVQDAHGVIALIDTGVSESKNVIDRVSVIDDALEGNEHGDDMVEAIVSQDAEAKILSIRAMDDNGFGTVSSLVAAMEYAIEQKVDIINLSVYGKATLVTSVLEHEIQKAVEAGIVVIGAAGNDGADVAGYMPGNVEAAYIIGAANEDGSRLDTSNFGATVDYNVVAGTTSEAAALFTGFVAANGMDAVTGVQNNGLIYSADFISDTWENAGKDKTKTVTLGNTVNGMVQFLTEDGTALEKNMNSYSVGSKVFIKVTPDDNYTLDHMNTYCDGNEFNLDIQYNLETKQFYFEMPDKDITLQVVFLRNQTPEELSELAYSSMPKTISRAAKVASNASARASEYLTVGDYISYEGYSTNRFSINGNVAFCLEPKRPTPSQGYHTRVNLYTVANANGSKQSTDRLRAAMWFSYGAPGFDKSMWPDSWIDGQPITDEQLYCLSHIMVARIFQNGAGDYGTSDEFKDWLWYWCTGNNESSYGQNTYHKIAGREDEVPDGFTAYILDTGGDQLVIGYDYVPKQYTNLTVDKKWIDGNNKSGVRPSSVTIQLYRSDSDKPIKTVTLSASNNWTYTFKNMLMKDGSKGYSYSVKEVSVPNYKSSNKAWTGAIDNGYHKVIENTVNLNTDLTIKKNWSDYDNSLGARPSSITVNLYRGTSNPVSTTGTPYRTATLSASNNWTYTFKDMPKQYGNTTYSYAIKEVDVSSDYVTSGSVWSGNDRDGYSKTLTNTLLVGYLKLHKDSSLPNVTNGNRCYDLKGAEYTVYQTRSGNTLSNPVGKLTTNSNGDTNTLRLLRRTYYVKETKAATGYELDSTIYTVTISGNHTESKPYLLNVKDVPGNDPTGIEIDKIYNGPDTDTVKKMPLTGTQFTIKYYDGYYNTENELKGKTPLRTWVLEVKEINGRYMAMLTDSYLVSGELYRDGAGQPCLPLGTITIQETKAAPGYTLDGYLKDKNGNVIATDSELYVAKITEDSGAVALQGGNEFKGENTPTPNIIKLKKFDSDGKTPLAGVTFEIRNSDGDLVEETKTNSKGEIVFDDLYPDVYTIKETATVDGHTLLKDPIVIEVPMMLTDKEVKDYGIDTKDESVVYNEANKTWYIHEFTFEVTNNVTFKMPMSGGFTTPMTFVPLIAGMGIMGGLGVVGFRKKRKK